ncbi:F-box and associated interaction domains-containing protein [Raphanus sativus]|nr:F-box and associated interaction domains-containing protein [Raphanus sativus]
MCVKAVVFSHHTSEFYQLLRVSVHFLITDSSGHLRICYQITDLDGKGSRSESIHGLILSHVFKIWNPTLKQFLALPYPDKCSSSQNGRWGSYLGYDPLEGKHKVLFMSTTKHTDQPRVLTLGGQESWRIITKGRCPRHRPCGYGRCFDGILYYRASRHGETGERFVLHLPCESVQKYSIDFRGTTDAGELVFAPFGFHETFYILYLDPRRNSTRKVIFESNMGDLRRRCGLDTNSKFTIEVFPNHIESLFSL